MTVGLAMVTQGEANTQLAQFSSQINTCSANGKGPWLTSIDYGSSVEGTYI